MPDTYTQHDKPLLLLPDELGAIASSHILLYFIALLFKHLDVILRDIRENREKHGDIEEKVKTFLFCLCIIDFGTIIEFFR